MKPPPRTNAEMVAMSHVRAFLRAHASPATLESLLDDLIRGEADVYAQNTVRGVYRELMGTLPPLPSLQRKKVESI